MELSRWRKSAKAAEGRVIPEIYRPVHEVDDTAGKVDKTGTKSTSSSTAVTASTPTLQPCVVGVKGRWYDVSAYVAFHPGGDIICEFHQKDATYHFLAYHDEKVRAQMRRKEGGREEEDSGRVRACGHGLVVYTREGDSPHF